MSEFSASESSLSHEAKRWKDYAKKLESSLKRAVYDGCTCDISRSYICGIHGHLNVMNERPK